MKGFALHVIHETIKAEEEMRQEVFASLPLDTTKESEEDRLLFDGN